MATSSQKSSEESLWNSLKRAQTYREFLRIYFDEKPISYASFARQTGFGRSFPSDVVSGRRRLSHNSFLIFEKNLALPVAGKRLFRMLLQLEEPDLFLDSPKASHEIINRIRELKVSKWTLSRKSLLESNAVDKILVDSNIMMVFACCGIKGKGSTYSEVLKKSGLPKLELDNFLKSLLAVNLLSVHSNGPKKNLTFESSDYFEPSDTHVFYNLNSNKPLLTKLFTNAANLAIERISNTHHEDNLFFTSVFCINSSKLKELKAQLRELTLKFIDESIAEEGDKMVRLTTAFHDHS